MALLTLPKGSSKDPDMKGCLWMDSSGFMTVLLSATCQCLECHSISNTQTVQMCLFFMEYGAIGRGQRTHYFCLWPCLTPPGFSPSTVLPCRKQMGLAGRDTEVLAGPPAATGLLALRMQIQITWGLSPGPADTPSVLPPA